MSATLPRRLFLTRGPNASRSICLTFDDGPHPEHTPRLLDVLRECGVGATFFVIGRHAERHPEVLRRMVAEGHAVGNHTFSHADLRTLSGRQTLDEVRRTNEALARILGRAPSLFRPPHGKVTAAKLWLLWREGQTVVLWNSDPKDYSRADPGEVLAWFRSHPPRGGDVVLMHDNHPHAARVLPAVIAEARSQGLDFTTPSRWIR